jgi:DNA-binding MarR family transcriptional regulator
MESMKSSDVGSRSIGFLIWHVSLRWRAQLDRELAPLEITATQYAVLATLYALTEAGTKPSQRELADFGGLGVMHVSNLVRGLERAGFVLRTESPADSRAVELSLTQRGAEVVKAGVGIVARLEEARLASLGGRNGEKALLLRELLSQLLRDAGP